MIDILREDLRRYKFEKKLSYFTEPGIYMAILFRFGHWLNVECKNIFCYPFRFLYRLVHPFFAMITGININCFAEIGPGFQIIHYGCIFITHGAVIGRNFSIYHGVTIGNNALYGSPGDVPTIGDNVSIGAGAKVIGKVIIGNNTIIGANAVVTKSFPEGGVFLGGIPAKIIKDYNGH